MTLRSMTLRGVTAGGMALRGTPAGALTERIPIRRLPAERRNRLEGTWREARPARIRAAFEASQRKDPGGWYVVGDSDSLGGDRSIVRTILGREVALWRGDDGRLLAGPGSCPHLGALLDGCEVRSGRMSCRWHGLSLGADGQAGWSPFTAHDDGVLLWVRLPSTGEVPAALPTLARRPPAATSLATVIAVRGVCEPADIVANRLDPWHGTWYHPYAFSHLTVDDAASDEQRLTVDVTFRLSRTWGVPVRAEFTCPDARTIVMTIVEGEGTGSVVETHATPIGTDFRGRPLTVMTEATIAHSDRPGFTLARRAARLVSPRVAATAAKLWVDDLAYAERRWQLRSRGEDYGG
jgi:hypothetical protein